MPPAQLRFLPWTRSGLAAVLPNPDAGTPAPAHPTVKVGITVTRRFAIVTMVVSPFDFKAALRGRACVDAGLRSRGRASALHD